jgi:hypothetical protein
MAVTALMLSAWAPGVSTGRLRVGATCCEMAAGHDCAPAANAPDDCCVLDTPASQRPATSALSFTVQPPVGVTVVLVPPVDGASSETARAAYTLELLKRPHAPTYVRTSRFLL